MLCAYTPCECLEPRLELRKALTVLMLDCWQREYDHRPYKDFKLKRLDFEERMERYFHPVRDFSVVVEFLGNRKLTSAYLSGLRLLACQNKMLEEFVQSLFHISKIVLKLMEFPNEFYTLMRDNVALMTVVHLNLKGTPLTTEDVTAMRVFLIHSVTLKHLNVASCSIDQYNFALLADGIHKSRSIRSINCSRLLGNHLTLDSGKIASIISELIWQNKLVSIVLQQCEFIAQDMEIIAEYLWKKNSKLKILDLAGNIIATDGAEYLFRAIANSGTLKHLDISANGLGPHGGDVVSKYLSSSYRLEYLDITHNGIDANIMSDILTTMKKPVKLKKLKLYGNKFDQRGANILKRLIDARVVPQETIDITYTFDETLADYRIIPYREASYEKKRFLKSNVEILLSDI